jgi:eukaryotic-like serine/threonine-protein kinase
MTQPGRGFDPAGGTATVTGLMAATEFSRGDMISERFRIERLLGMGGMGVVYQAHDQKLNVPVALKLLRPELATRPDAFERFKQELLLARQVSSPHVVRIHDLVQHGAIWLISMDYVDGRSLEKLLDERGALPPAEALRITRQLALGLMAAHHRGVVHRDLKPANVLVTETGDALITDFGVARAVGSTGITGSGVIIGTPEYLSPEQARADPVDGRSDLYALGLMLYEMLSGKLPFSGGTPAEMLAQRIVRSPPPVGSVKPELPALAQRVCARLLELRPLRRFQSAEEVVNAIDSGNVPVLRAHRAAIALALLALVAIAWGIAPVTRWIASRGAVDPAAVATTTVPTAPMLDVAVMPAVPEGIDGDTDANDLVRGIASTLAWQIGDGRGLAVPDPDRVLRALSEQGLDAAAARRFRPKLEAALGTRQLVEIDAKRDGEQWQIAFALRRAGEVQPTWSASTPAVTVDALPGALATLTRALAQAAGASDAESTWPTSATLQRTGALARGDKTAPELTATPGREALAWQYLATLDRSGNTVAATAAAREVHDALAADTSSAGVRARAFAALLLGDNADAIALATPALTRRAHDHPLRLVLARALASEGDFDRARENLEQIVREDPRDVAAWYNLGKFALMQGEAQRAVDEYLVRAEVLANRLDDRRVLADTTNAQGIGYRQLGQLEPAGEKFEKAARLRGALGDVRGEATSLRNLSTVRAIQGDFTGAQTALDRARAILQPLGDAAALAEVVNDVGVLEEERGEFRKALEAYREALNFRQGQGDRRLVGESLINVGFAYYQIGEFDNAQVYWQQAQSEYAGIDDRAGAVRAQQSLGLAYTARGEFARARTALRESLAQAEDLQLADERAVSLASLAELDRLEGHIETALTGARAAHALYASREDPRGTTEMQLLQSTALADIGDWAGATSALAGLDAEKIGSREQAAMLQTRVATIALGEQRLADAARFATAAIDSATAAHTLGHELEARLLRARVALAMKDDARARRELATVKQALSRYASVPLQIAALETSLALGASPTADYGDARSRLARLPSWGRAWIVHAIAASRFPAGATRDAARTSAITAHDALGATLSAPHRASLQAYGVALGLPAVDAP